MLIVMLYLTIIINLFLFCQKKKISLQLSLILFSLLYAKICTGNIFWSLVNFIPSLIAEFWKQIPINEPYRVILGDVRDKLYNTRERSRHMLSNGFSDIPEESTFTNVEQVLFSHISASFSIRLL